MNPNLYKQVKKMNKCLKEINSMGYIVFFKDGPHHQLMKIEKKFKKNMQKEKKPKHESYAIFGEWVSGGEESSASLSDESNKKFTTRMGLSSNTCFIAKGMDNDVSDDDSDSPSIDELLDLVLTANSGSSEADRSNWSGLCSPRRIRVFVKSPHIILFMKGYVFPGL